MSVGNKFLRKTKQTSNKQKIKPQQRVTNKKN